MSILVHSLLRKEAAFGLVKVLTKVNDVVAVDLNMVLLTDWDECWSQAAARQNRSGRIFVSPLASLGSGL